MSHDQLPTNKVTDEQLPPYPHSKSDTETPPKENRDAPRYSLRQKMGAGAAVVVLGGLSALGINKLSGDNDANPFNKDVPTFASANGMTYEVNELAPKPTDPVALVEMYKSPVGSESFEAIVNEDAREKLENDPLYGTAASNFINEQSGEALRGEAIYSILDTKARAEAKLYNNLDKFKDSDAAAAIINPPALFTVEDLQASSAANLSDGLRKAIISGAGFNAEGFSRTQQLSKLVSLELGDDGTTVSPEVKELLQIVRADNEYQEAPVNGITGTDYVDEVVQRMPELRETYPEELAKELETPNQITSVSVIDTVYYDYDDVAGRGLTTIDANVTYVTPNGTTVNMIKRFIVAPANEVSVKTEGDTPAPVSMKLLNFSDINLTLS